MLNSESHYRKNMKKALKNLSPKDAKEAIDEGTLEGMEEKI